MPFSVMGTGPTGIKSAVRNSAASGIVLAMKWEEDGVRDILITPPGKKAQCFKAFRDQHYGRSRSASEPHQTQFRPHPLRS